MSAVEQTTIPVYRFAMVIPGRRRTFRSKAAAYRALALQLLTVKYTTVDDYRETEWSRPRKEREFTEQAQFLFGVGEWHERGGVTEWGDHVKRVARRLRMRDEWTTRRDAGRRG